MFKYTGFMNFFPINTRLKIIFQKVLIALAGFIVYIVLAIGGQIFLEYVVYNFLSFPESGSYGDVLTILLWLPIIHLISLVIAYLLVKKMGFYKDFTMLLVVIYIFFFLLLFGYIKDLVRSSTYVTVPETQIINLKSSSTTPVSVDDKTDWKIFRNENLGIEIKYPPNSIEKISSSSVSIFPLPQPVEFGPSFNVYKKVYRLDIDIDKHIDSFAANLGLKITDRVNITINDINWYKIEYIDKSGVGPESSYTSYFVINGRYVYLVTYTNSYVANKKEFESMMYTLKFI